ncbi:MAG: hypothetical protein ACYC2U_07255 [Candidatus Amoebophilus sp.]
MCQTSSSIEITPCDKGGGKATAPTALSTHSTNDDNDEAPSPSSGGHCGRSPRCPPGNAGSRERMAESHSAGAGGHPRHPAINS